MARAPQARERARLLRGTAVLLLVVGAWALRPAGAAGVGFTLPGPGGRALHQWDPSRSWPGGEQFDPRLDRPVRFWRAGLTLSEVFSGLQEQTGVVFGFWPEGDENARVRVSLYLSAEGPPTLRDVMAQLMWVTDCAFGYSEGEAGVSAYYLLGTSLGRGALAARAEEEKTAEARAKDGKLDEQAGNEEAVRRKLAELREALRLSREDLIARYRGVDDYLLLTLLDPARRAGAEYVCKALQNGSGGSLEREWSWEELSEEDRALIREAFAPGCGWRSPAPPVPAEHGWSDDADISVEVHGASLGRIELWACKVLDRREGITFQALIGGQPLVVYGEGDHWLSEQEALSLARLLGEEIPPGEEAAYWRRMSAEFAAARAKRRREERRQWLTGLDSLSSEAREHLLSLALGLEEGRAYALWEVQEAVADASGLNVISDCFWQGRRPLGEAGSALEVLRMSCQRLAEEAGQEAGKPEWQVAWEWGDAGSFLRFRSEDRELWRAALLPIAALRQVDEYVAPCLPEAGDSGQRGGTRRLRLRVDGGKLAEAAGLLNDVQLEYGGRMTYEDPSEELGACRHALREALLGVAAKDVDFFRLLASFSDEQWTKAGATGLNCAELSEEQLLRVRKVLARKGCSVEEEPGGVAAWRVNTDGSFRGHGSAPAAGTDQAPVDGFEASKRVSYEQLKEALEAAPRDPTEFRAAIENDLTRGLPDGLDLSDIVPGWEPGSYWGAFARWWFRYEMEVSVELPRDGVTTTGTGGPKTVSR